jgi:membrane carboxypeptidase/penicillin-binding protein
VQTGCGNPRILEEVTHFFGKRARDLSLDEAALLAILPRAPSRYDPARHPEAAMRRRAHVLDLMVLLCLGALLLRRLGWRA